MPLLGILLLLGGCTSSTAADDSIDGRDLRLAGEALVELAQSEVILTQTKKYTRHFKNGLYYEDLSEAQRELNELYNEHMRKEIDQYIKENLPILKDVPYILQNEIEYVNRDAKDYAEGKTKAEDIIDNPNSIMSIKLRWYLFEDFTQEGEKGNAGFLLDYEYIGKILVEKYIMQGIESFDVRAIAYEPSILERYDIQELEQNGDIYNLLYNERKTWEVSLYKTYYSDDSIKTGKHTPRGGEGAGNREEKTQLLKEKYGLDFKVDFGYWYYPEKYPQVKFGATVSKEETRSHFQSAMYQYLANERVRRVIEEAGLSDKVVFLVTTETWGGFGGDALPSASYNFGEGFDEDYFLAQGYHGEVCVTLIYLDTEMPNELEYEEEKEYIARIKSDLFKKILFPLHEEICFGTGEQINANGDKEISWVKDIYLEAYKVSDYDREVIIDLFKKYPLTEREEKPDLGMADIDSPLFRARAETQGFHYLDVFGEQIMYSEVDGKGIDKRIEETLLSDTANEES